MKRCGNCRYWDAKHGRVAKLPELDDYGIGEPGICRKHKPGGERIAKAVIIGVQPITDANDVCGEWREATKNGE